jgi:hypothetical protein
MEFIGTGAMATYVNTPRLDLRYVELGLDAGIAIKRGIAMIYVMTRVIRVQRCHPTHKDDGLHGV